MKEEATRFLEEPKRITENKMTPNPTATKRRRGL